MSYLLRLRPQQDKRLVKPTSTKIPKLYSSTMVLMPLEPPTTFLFSSKEAASISSNNNNNNNNKSIRKGSGLKSLQAVQTIDFSKNKKNASNTSNPNIPRRRVRYRYTSSIVDEVLDEDSFSDATALLSNVTKTLTATACAAAAAAAAAVVDHRLLLDATDTITSHSDEEDLVLAAPAVPEAAMANDPRLFLRQAQLPPLTLHERFWLLRSQASAYATAAALRAKKTNSTVFSIPLQASRMNQPRRPDAQDVQPVHKKMALKDHVDDCNSNYSEYIQRPPRSPPCLFLSGDVTTTAEVYDNNCFTNNNSRTSDSCLNVSDAVTSARAVESAPQLSPKREHEGQQEDHVPSRVVVSIDNNTGLENNEQASIVAVNTFLNGRTITTGKVASFAALQRTASFPPRMLVDEQVFTSDDDDDDDYVDIQEALPGEARSALNGEDLECGASYERDNGNENCVEWGVAPVLPSSCRNSLCQDDSNDQDIEEQARKHLEFAIGSWNRNVLSYMQDAPMSALLRAVEENMASDESSSESSLSPLSSNQVSSDSSVSSTNAEMAEKLKKSLTFVLPFRRNRQLCQNMSNIDRMKRFPHRGWKHNSCQGLKELKVAKSGIPQEVEIRTKPSLESFNSNHTKSTSGSTVSSAEEGGEEEERCDDLDVVLSFHSRQPQDGTLLRPHGKDNVESLTTSLAKLTSDVPHNKCSPESVTFSAGTAVETTQSNLTKTTATTSSSSSGTASCSSAMANHADDNLHSSNSITDNKTCYDSVDDWRRSVLYEWDNRNWIRVVDLPKDIALVGALS